MFRGPPEVELAAEGMVLPSQSFLGGHGMPRGHRRKVPATEMPVERRLAHVPNAFNGAVAAMADPITAKEFAAEALRLATHTEEKAIRAFLTSAYGGAFGVDVAQRVAGGEGVRLAIAVVVREWMARQPTEAEAEALAIKPEVPYLSAVITAAGIAQA
jgi:hypothetical protein